MAMRTWKCTICGNVQAGDAAPPHCRECGARDAMFEPSTEPPHGISHNPLQPHDPGEQHGVLVGPGDGCLEND
jgi:hypothetical protein